LSRIFELYGHRLDRWNEEAEGNLRRARCPFMNAVCDGGGNRHQSTIDIRGNADLRRRIPDMDSIQCGVCSI
jgi:hypothetical protein